MKDLIWIKLKSRLACDKCEIKKFCNSAPSEKIEVLGPCSNKRGYYMLDKQGLVEDPEEIQTEYEWKKERYELLNNSPATMEQAIYDEISDLGRYLADNKPTNYQTCTKENTKVGDEVRSPDTHTFKLEITYISRNGNIIMAINNNGVEGQYTLNKYEINLYKDKE